MPTNGQATVLSRTRHDAEEIQPYPLLPLFAQITALGSLPTGWNGYDAVPPSSGSVATAVAWVAQAYKTALADNIFWYAPNVTAGANGEVVLEWWAASKLLTIYMDGDSVEYMKYNRDGDNGPREHGDARDASVQAMLLRWFSE